MTADVNNHVSLDTLRHSTRKVVSTEHPPQMESLKSNPDMVELSERYRQYKAEQWEANGEDGVQKLSVVSYQPELRQRLMETEERAVYKYTDIISHGCELRIRFAGIERAMDQEVGSIFNAQYGKDSKIDWKKHESLSSAEYVNNYWAHDDDFKDSMNWIEKDKESINQALDSIFSEAGISKETRNGVVIEIAHDGTFSVSGINERDKESIETVLSSNSDLVFGMLKNSAMRASIDLDYVKETDESLAIEMTLADAYLREKVGYGIAEIDVFQLHSSKTDPKLKELLAEDILLERQLYRFGEKLHNGFSNTFSAQWKLS